MEFSCEHCGMAELECAERSCDFCGDGMCMRCTIDHDDRDQCPNAPVCRTKDDRPDFSGFAAALRAEAEGTGVIHRNDRTGQADHDQRVLLELAERIEAVGDRMGYCSKTEPKPNDGYPEGWPRCPACGQAALDGHITCGDVRCGEGARRV